MHSGFAEPQHPTKYADITSHDHVATCSNHHAARLLRTQPLPPRAPMEDSRMCPAAMPLQALPPMCFKDCCVIFTYLCVHMQHILPVQTEGCVLQARCNLQATSTTGTGAALGRADSPSNGSSNSCHG